MAAKEKFYVTTPIYYVNARPHIGHTYTTIVADTIARYKRMCGYDVTFLTGTDEHGQKIERSAQAAGKTPKQFVDEVADDYRKLWDALGLPYDIFLRTTETRHRDSVHKLFLEVKKNGYIRKGTYKGQYCVHDELYVTDPTEEGNCPDCGRPTEHVEEENYFFKLSELKNPLLDHYEKHPEFIRPESRRNEVMSFVRSGLRDLSISRARLKWGIPFPDDPGHVFYVWFDALTNYLTGTGYGDPARQAEYERLWPADVHLVGKEIVRFHAVYWPAFLLAAGLPLPKTILAHGWWIFDQEKMSKSRGNIVRPQPIAEAMGVDALRYFLLREMILGQDSNFRYDTLLTRYNADLANDYGNLVSRVLKMIEQNFDGIVPPGTNANDEDKQVATAAQQAITETKSFFDNYEFSRGLESVWVLISVLNKYLVETQPWMLAGDDGKRTRLESVLWTAAEGVRVATVLLAPVIPASADRIWKQLGQEGTPESQPLDTLEWGGLKAGAKLGKVEPVFPRLDKAKTIKKIEELEAALDASSAGGKPDATGGYTVDEETNLITIGDFTKVELRVGEIKTAERIPKADKLLKLTVDIGSEVRQILAGIAEHYEPEPLVGRKIVIVANLKPRKMRGLESQGMLLAASVGDEDRPVLATFAEDVPNGARLK